MYTYYKEKDKKLPIVYKEGKLDSKKLKDEFVLLLPLSTSYIYSFYRDYSLIDTFGSYISIIFDPKFLTPKFTKEFLEDKNLLAIDLDAYTIFTFLSFGETTNKTYLSYEDKQAIREIMEELGERLKNQIESYWPCQVRTLLSQLLSRITTLNLQEPYGNREYDVVEVANYLDRNYYEEINIKYLTEKFWVNRDKLQKTFQKQFSDTPMSYLSKVRIDKAQELLLNTRLPVTEIISKVGFASISNFNDKFKKRAGMTPRQYRKINNPK